MVLYSFMILLCRAQLLAEYGLRSSERSVGFPCPVTEAHLSRQEDKGKKKKDMTLREMSQEKPLVEMVCGCINFTQMVLQV